MASHATSRDDLRALWAPIEAVESAEGADAASGRSYRPGETADLALEPAPSPPPADAPPRADTEAPTRLGELSAPERLPGEGESDDGREGDGRPASSHAAKSPGEAAEGNAASSTGNAIASSAGDPVASSASAAALPLNAISSTMSVAYSPDADSDAPRTPAPKRPSGGGSGPERAAGTPNAAGAPNSAGAVRATGASNAAGGPKASGAPTATAPAPAGVESFELQERIGQGGMGVVFRAVQGSLGREVAVKQAWRKGERATAQFIAEAQITGRLEHANIVPVHLLGRTPEGTPQLAMKLVKGTSWKELLHGPKGAGLGLKDHLGILLAVCNATAFAHERGYIHRDLKPENVMVGEFGQVFVMDWGLAIPIGRARRARSPAGTPCYMAPELAAGEGAAQGPHTDVYLLGACLHEVVTHRRRHEGPSVYNVLASAIESAPVAYDAAVPGELAAICNCATACDPAERYQSVAELRRALERFLEHREAHAVIDKGTRLLGELRRAIASLAEMPEGAREGRATEIHRLHAEARFAFQHALSIWPGAADARAGLRDASRAMLDHALAIGDAPLAARILPECEDPGAAARVEALRERLAARERELAALREAARRHDWSAVAEPLGNTFIGAAILGAAGAILSKYAILHAEQRGLYHPRLPWIALCVVVGIYAVLKLRARGVTGSLVSPRVLGTWAAVAIGCALTGLTAEQRGAPPFRDACYQAWMIGIGFAAMGFEVRRWLLAPALAFFAGGCVMVFTPQHNPEIFGVLWLAVFSGVGMALRRSAR